MLFELKQIATCLTADDKLERTCKETGVTYLKITIPTPIGKTAEMQEESERGWQVSGPRFEPKIGVCTVPAWAW
jgi:hypothetical protein